MPLDDKNEARYEIHRAYYVAFKEQNSELTQSVVYFERNDKLIVLYASVGSAHNATVVEDLSQVSGALELAQQDYKSDAVYAAQFVVFKALSEPGLEVSAYRFVHQTNRDQILFVDRGSLTVSVLTESTEGLCQKKGVNSEERAACFEALKQAKANGTLPPDTATVYSGAEKESTASPTASPVPEQTVSGAGALPVAAAAASADALLAVPESTALLEKERVFPLRCLTSKEGRKRLFYFVYEGVPRIMGAQHIPPVDTSNPGQAPQWKQVLDLTRMGSEVAALNNNLDAGRVSEGRYVVVSKDGTTCLSADIPKDAAHLWTLGRSGSQYVVPEQGELSKSSSASIDRDECLNTLKDYVEKHHGRAAAERQAPRMAPSKSAPNLLAKTVLAQALETFRKEGGSWFASRLIFGFFTWNESSTIITRLNVRADVDQDTAAVGTVHKHQCLKAASDSVEALYVRYKKNGGGVLAAAHIFGVFGWNTFKKAQQTMQKRAQSNPNGASARTTTLGRV